MTTFFLDFENGNDANDGLTFENRWKTFAGGATAARTAPGDTIRVMASPDPTPIGTCRWESRRLRQSQYGITNISNTTPIVLTLASMTITALELKTGDTVGITSVGTNSAAGIWTVGDVTSTTITLLNADGSNSIGSAVLASTGYIYQMSHAVVEIPNNLIKNIACHGNYSQQPAWIAASSNATVAASVNNYVKEGGQYATISVLAAFTTGLAAYCTLPSTLDLSAFQQISFWFAQTSGTNSTAGQVSLCLCSDTVGAVPVHTIPLPAIPYVSSTPQWCAHVHDFATNLNSAIKSVALYINSDLAAQTFTLSNIIACKASSSPDAITLNSLISKNTENEHWYTIQSINYNRLILDNIVTRGNAEGLRGYFGVSESVTTYKREPILTGASSTTTAIKHQLQKSGTSASALITYSFGWDRTNMSVKSGETWLSGQNGFGALFGFSGRSFVKLDGVGAVRFNYGLYMPSVNDVYFGTIKFSSCSNALQNAGSRATYDKVMVYGNGTSPISLGYTSYADTVYADGVITNYGISVTNNMYIKNLYARNNGSYGVELNTNGYVENLHAYRNVNGIIFSGNGTAKYAVLLGNSGGSFVASNSGDGKILSGYSQDNVGVLAQVSSGNLLVRNFNVLEGSGKISASYGSTTQSGRAYFEKMSGDKLVNYIYSPVGYFTSQTSVKHDSSADFAWLATVSTNTYANLPLRMTVGNFALEANTQTTVGIWVYRINSLFTIRLYTEGGYLDGIPDTVYVDATTTGAWELIQFNVTPTESGVIEVKLSIFGSTTGNAAYIGDMTLA